MHCYLTVSDVHFYESNLGTPASISTCYLRAEMDFM